MIRISQLKLPVTHTRDDLERKLARTIRVSPEQIHSYKIVKQSIDARKKEELLYIYTIDVQVSKEETVLRKNYKNVAAVRETTYVFPESGEKDLRHPPVVIGSGPAGLFCGLMLARAGYCPILLERGEDVDARTKRVREFWLTGVLDEGSNVQFGEGGAGTFSDGKLNTLVKDPSGRNKKVLEILTEFGADPAILYQNKPHIGTDVLSGIVKAIRQEILRLGGTVKFCSAVTGVTIRDGRITQVKTKEQTFETDAVILAIGHSARDTFSMLYEAGVPMESKAFAVGLRIQHPQRMINHSQYGLEDPGTLGAANYKLTHQCKNGRGVYSFCMCPGGYVVDASSEKGRLAVNGMSDHARDGVNANSALIVTVTPADFQGSGPLAGIQYQRRLEELAYQAGNGRVPIQLYGDFKEGKPSSALGEIEPQMRGRYQLSNLRDILPEYISQSLVEGVERFGQVIRGFDRYDSIFAGVESRTSSPIRIPRDETFESEIRGLFPCGEGAGYAGGITSAAMDGLRVAEEIAKRYRPLAP